MWTVVVSDNKAMRKIFAISLALHPIAALTGSRITRRTTGRVLRDSARLRRACGHGGHGHGFRRRGRRCGRFPERGPAPLRHRLRDGPAVRVRVLVRARMRARGLGARARAVVWVRVRGARARARVKMKIGVTTRMRGRARARARAGVSLRDGGAPVAALRLSEVQQHLEDVVDGKHLGAGAGGVAADGAEGQDLPRALQGRCRGAAGLQGCRAAAATAGVQRPRSGLARSHGRRLGRSAGTWRDIAGRSQLAAPARAPAAVSTACARRWGGARCAPG